MMTKATTQATNTVQHFEVNGFTIEVENNLISEIYNHKGEVASDRAATILLANLEERLISMPTASSFSELNSFSMRMVEATERDEELKEIMNSSQRQVEYVTLQSPFFGYSIHLTIVDSNVRFVAVTNNDSRIHFSRTYEEQDKIKRDAFDEMFTSSKELDEIVQSCFNLYLYPMKGTREEGNIMGSQIAEFGLLLNIPDSGSDLAEGVKEILDLHGVRYE